MWLCLGGRQSDNEFSLELYLNLHNYWWEQKWMRKGMWEAGNNNSLLPIRSDLKTRSYGTPITSEYITVLHRDSDHFFGILEWVK